MRPQSSIITSAETARDACTDLLDSQPADAIVFDWMLAGATRDRLLNRIARRVYNTGLPALNRARLEHGLAPLEHWEDQLLGADAI